MNSSNLTYFISFDSNEGMAHYEGDIGQSYKAFIAEATKAGIARGLIDEGNSVLDHDHHVESF